MDLLAEIVGPFPANITRLTNLGECIALYCNRSCSRGHVVCVERQSWKLTGLVVPNVSRFSCMKHVSPSLVPHLSPSFVHSVALSLSLSLSLSLYVRVCVSSAQRTLVCLPLDWRKTLFQMDSIILQPSVSLCGCGEVR